MENLNSNPLSIDQVQDELIEQFTLFDDWAERYQLLISLGRSTISFPKEKQIDEYFVPGCQSNVWFDISKKTDGTLNISGTSDASIVAGLVALMIKLYHNQTPQDILNHLPPRLIEAIGFEGHLSPNRQTGLYAMIKAIELAANTAA